MYTTKVKTKTGALCHLFFHCCLKSGTFEKPEIAWVSARFVALGMHERLNFKQEILKYRSYRDSIGDEKAYLQYLVGLIQPEKVQALYSYCVEMAMVDTRLEPDEEELLDQVASVLKIGDREKNIIRKLMIQRKSVEQEKAF